MATAKKTTNQPPEAPSGALAALSNDLAATVERVCAYVVAVEGRADIGSSGFYLDSSTIVTADHTLEREHIDVVFADGRVEQARVIGRDPATDIALLSVSTRGPQPVSFAHTAIVGTIALAMARENDGYLAATMGVVGSVGAGWRTAHGGYIDRFLRADCAISPRFSGGPLFDATGRIIGMNTWGFARRQALTIPMSTIERIAGTLHVRGIVSSLTVGNPDRVSHVDD